MLAAKPFFDVLLGDVQNFAASLKPKEGVEYPRGLSLDEQCVQAIRIFFACHGVVVGAARFSRSHTLRRRHYSPTFLRHSQASLAMMTSCGCPLNLTGWFHFTHRYLVPHLPSHDGFSHRVSRVAHGWILTCMGTLNDLSYVHFTCGNFNNYLTIKDV